MMNGCTIFLSLISAFLLCVQAVSVTDAFKKDWVQYNSGPAIKHALLDHENVVELSLQNILYFKNIASSKVLNYIDLSLHGSDDFKVGNMTIITFSKESLVVTVFEKKSGVFIASIPLKAPSVQILAFGDFGWTILQDGVENGELITWDGQKLHSLGTFYARTFLVYRTPQTNYICIDSSAFLLSYTEEDGNKTALNISNVEYGALFDHLFPYGALDEIKLSAGNRSPLYITENIAASYHNTLFVIYKVSGDDTKAVYRKTFDPIVDVQALGSILVVITEKKAYIYDLAQFLSTGSVSAIQSTTVKVHPFLKLVELTPGHFSVLNGNAKNDQFYVHDYEIKSGTSFVHKLVSSPFTANGGAIIMNVPPLLSKIEEAHHLVEETRSVSIIHRWLLRVKTHLSQFGRLVSRVILRKKAPAIATIEDDVFGFNKVLVQVDELRALVAAKSSKDGALLWVRDFLDLGKFLDVRALGSYVYVIFESEVETLDLTSGKSITTRDFDGTIEKVFSLATSMEDEIEESLAPEALAVKIGHKLEFLTGEQNVTSSQFIIHQNANTLQSYKVDGTNLRSTWQWKKPNQKLLAVAKNSDSITTAGGISRYDRSVLYKYLNPNLVSIISEDGDVLRFTLLDGVTGAVIYTQEHNGEKIDPESISITQKDNWVVYSMFVVAPRSEQRLVVIDLFQDIKDPSGKAKTSFKSANVTALTKTFIYPERIVALESTNTKFGVTVKSIIALTESGSLVEIPKYLLNSRRVDGRKMTANDQMDDFRMLPYDPVIPQNTFKILNHKNKLQLSQKKQKILVQPTELESTSVVCLVNEFNDFCTVVQPSSSYDLLTSDFDKTKLILTIAVLFAAYIFTKPLVESKKLNQRWVD